jgi:hypothetical protein
VPPGEQILGLFILAALVAWLVIRLRNRPQKPFSEVAPKPLTVAAIVDGAETSSESKAADQGVVAESNPAGPDVSELDQELKEIYDKAGHPDSFTEAKEKVTALAAELAERDGIDNDEALRTAYRTSLAEHHEYLAAKGIT